MALAARMDEFGGKGGWIAATILGFVLYWPIGLAVLLYLIFSGRVRAWRFEGPGRWYNQGSSHAGGCAWGWSGQGSARAKPSGNHAFDEYRAETLRRLEEEQTEFVEYLERLRQAKDKAEFDQFMAERRRRSTPPEQPVDVA